MSDYEITHLRDEIARLTRERDGMRAALEWAAGKPETLDDGENIHCIECCALYGQPHEPECHIGAALSPSPPAEERESGT